MPYEQILLLSKSLLCICLMSLSMTAQVSSPEPTPPQSNKDFINQFQIVDYDSPEPIDLKEREKRKLKGKRYDNRHWVLRNPHPETSGVGCDDCVDPPPAVPALESKLIVIGQIINASAFLSNDKQGIYTEFDIQIEELLKADNSKKLS